MHTLCNSKVFFWSILINLFFLPAIASATPDFIVESVDAPSSANEGDSITVQVTVQNQGYTIDQAGTYIRVEILLSSDNDISLTDQSLAHFNVGKDALQTGLTVSQSISFTLPDGVHGSYYIGAYVDYTSNTGTDGYWTELDETNNTGYDSTPINISSTDLQPPAPSLNTPSNGITTDDQTPDLSWSQSGSATYFQVQVATDSGFSKLIIDESNWNSFNYTPSPLDDDTYWWRVRTYSGSWSSWSKSRWFTVNAHLPAPVLGSPIGGQNLIGPPYHFTWNEVNEAGAYNLKVSTTPDFSTTIFNENAIPANSTSYNYDGSLQWGQTHYWQMRTLNSDGTVWGEWSDVESFIPRQASQVDLYSPESAETVTSANINFDWSDVPGIDHYEILVDNNSGFGSPEIHEPGIHIRSPQTLTESQYQVTNYLPDNTYYWKVIAHLTDGTTQESEIRSFTYHLPVAEKPVFVPLFRMYNPTNKDHFYTTSPAQRDAATGYTYEKVECCISDRKFNHENCGYLFRLYNPSSDVHYYTSDDNDRNQHIIDGYNYEGIVGFLYTLTGEGVIPLQHLEKGGDTDNFYTIGNMEAKQAVDNGYVFQGIVGYVSPDGIKEPLVHSRPQANFGGADLGSGAYRGLHNLDLTMKGRGLDLSFAHYYNSFNFKNIPMGPGWSHSLCVYAKEGFDGTVFVFWGNGTTSIFSPNEGGYLDQTGNHDHLELVDDGSNYGYNLTRKNQTVYQFRRFSAYPYTPYGENAIVLLKVRDAFGNELTFDYQNTTTISDDMGRSFELHYDGMTRQLTDVVEREGEAVKRSIHFSYDADGLLKSYTDARGKITRYEYYDEPETLRHQLLKSITYPEGNTVAIDYDQATGKVTSIKNSSTSNPTIISYEPESNLTSVYDPVTKAHFQYEHIGGILSRFKEASDTNSTVIEHNDPHNPNLPTRVVDADNHATTFAYDSHGNLIKVTNARGWEATYTYNERNKIKTATVYHDPNDLNPATTIYTYDTTNPNLLKSINRPETGIVKLFYNANNQVERLEDGRNNSTRFAYDAYGNLEQITDANGNITRYVNDYAGRTIAVIDAKGMKTTYSYDNNDNPKDIAKYAADGQTIIRTVNRDYDDNNNLNNVRWNNSGTESLTDYIYDNRDRLQSVIKPGGLTTTFTYYDNDLPHTITDANNVTATLSYDDHNRLQGKDFPGEGEDISYTYYQNGALASGFRTQAESTSKTSFTFNDLNLIKKVTDPFGKEVTYGYDNAGHLTSIGYPGGFTVTYTYDNDERLKTVSAGGNLLATYFYDAAGNLERIERSNGINTIYTFDQASRLTGITEQNTGGSILWSYTYVLDEVGNHKSVEAVNEPLEFTAQAEDISYSNDKASNRLLTAGDTDYTYDNNGNRITKSTGGVITTYDWDYENHLTAIVTSGQTSRTFTYDTLGHRIAREVDGVTTRYVLDLNNSMSRVLMETDTSGNPKAYYVYGHGLVARVAADGITRRFYHFNHRGDTVALTDDSGQITDRYAYDEYGRMQAGSGNTTDNPFTFVGRFGVMNEGDGLYFMRARFYDARVGRFLSEDPLGFEGGDWNLFAYVGGRPLVGIDPSGLSVSKTERLARIMRLVKEGAKADQELIKAERNVRLLEYANNGLSTLCSLNPVASWTNFTVNSLNEIYLGYQNRSLGDSLEKVLINLTFKSFTQAIKGALLKNFKPKEEFLNGFLNTYDGVVIEHEFLKDWLMQEGLFGL